MSTDNVNIPATKTADAPLTGLMFILISLSAGVIFVILAQDFYLAGVMALLTLALQMITTERGLRFVPVMAVVAIWLSGYPDLSWMLETENAEYVAGIALIVCGLLALELRLQHGKEHGKFLAMAFIVLGALLGGYDEVTILIVICMALVGYIFYFYGIDAPTTDTTPDAPTTAAERNES